MKPEIRCTECGAELEPEDQFCDQCGFPVSAPALVARDTQDKETRKPNRCNACDAALNEEDRFCRFCGHPTTRGIAVAVPAAEREPATTPSGAPHEPPIAVAQERRRRLIVGWACVWGLSFGVGKGAAFFYRISESFGIEFALQYELENTIFAASYWLMQGAIAGAVAALFTGVLLRWSSAAFRVTLAVQIISAWVVLLLAMAVSQEEALVGFGPAILGTLMGWSVGIHARRQEPTIEWIPVFLTGLVWGIISAIVSSLPSAMA